MQHLVGHLSNSAIFKQLAVNLYSIGNISEKKKQNYERIFVIGEFFLIRPTSKRRTSDLICKNVQNHLQLSSSIRFSYQPNSRTDNVFLNFISSFLHSKDGRLNRTLATHNDFVCFVFCFFYLKKKNKQQKVRW